MYTMMCLFHLVLFGMCCLPHSDGASCSNAAPNLLVTPNTSQSETKRLDKETNIEIMHQDTEGRIYTIHLIFVKSEGNQTFMVTVCKKCNDEYETDTSLIENGLMNGSNWTQPCDIKLLTNGRREYNVTISFRPGLPTMLPEIQTAISTMQTGLSTSATDAHTSISTMRTGQSSSPSESTRATMKGDKRSSSPGSSAVWVTLVVVAVLLVAALVVFIIVRNQRKKYSDKAESPNPIVASGGESPEQLAGDDVVYNSSYQSQGTVDGDVYNIAYQSTDAIRGHSAPDSSELDHEYAYADANNSRGTGDSDVHRDQIYNIAYQSADDMYSKAETRQEFEEAQNGSSNEGGTVVRSAEGSGDAHLDVDDLYRKPTDGKRPQKQGYDYVDPASIGYVPGNE